jgi:DeoR/GlpR family transcriptional regulator of sugar metabolism
MKSDVKKRMDLLKAVLLGRMGSDIKIEVLHQEINDTLHQDISRSAVIDSLRKLKIGGLRGHRLTIGRDYARIERSAMTVLEERTAQRVQTKRRLGIVLWQALFGVDLEGQRQGIEKVEVSLVRHSTYVLKLEALRRKMSVNIMIDAGSSTSIAVEELLGVDSVPIHVKTDDGSPKLFHPRFITNSLAIAKVVTESRHYNSIEVRLIGGDLRVDRGSICGTLTEICLAGWNMRADLSIVGATGFRVDYKGAPCFGCDDVSEARLKGAMLELGWFRVILLDSSKLKAPEVSSVFAPLSSDLIDLVVIDDGSEINAQEQVQDFLRQASAAGVHTLLLKTESKETGKKNNGANSSQSSKSDVVSPTTREKIANPTRKLKRS